MEYAEVYRRGPHLIIVPTSVLKNWEMEFKKFLPGFKIIAYYGNAKERKERRHGWKALNAFNVCITSYQLILADQHIFRRMPWVYMILDEAHNIKNFKSQRWQDLFTFRPARRLLLTGTPLQVRFACIVACPTLILSRVHRIISWSYGR